MDKSVAMGVHALDQSVAYVSELIGEASTIDSEAISILLTALLLRLRAIGFTPAEESKESVEWIRQQLNNSDDFVYLLSVCAYCGLLSAILANAQVDDVERDTE